MDTHTQTPTWILYRTSWLKGSWAALSNGRLTDCHSKILSNYALRLFNSQVQSAIDQLEWKTERYATHRSAPRPKRMVITPPNLADSTRSQRERGSEPGQLVYPTLTSFYKLTWGFPWRLPVFLLKEETIIPTNGWRVIRLNTVWTAHTSRLSGHTEMFT